MKYHQEIEFWLNMILSGMKENNSRDEFRNVILVGTHKDLLDIDREEQNKKATKYFDDLKELFINRAHLKLIRTCMAMDNKGGDVDQFEQLRAAIMEAIQENCPWNETRPIKWLLLEKELQSLQYDSKLSSVQQNLVSYQDVKTYAKSFHIDTDEDLMTFLEFHHLTADITFFRGHTLGKYTVVNPQWLIDVFRAIITLDEFRPKEIQLDTEVHQLKSEGLLNVDKLLLKKIWERFFQTDSESEIKNYLLNLMTEFDLAVKYDDEQYLIPCLLPWQPCSNTEQFPDQIAPDLYFNFHSSVQSHKKAKLGAKTYDHFIPAGLFQKVMSRCSKHGWVWTDKRWRNSVNFAVGDTIVVFHLGSTWIKMNIIVLDTTKSVSFAKYFHKVKSHIDALLKTYHQNMWHEICFNPCESSGHECLCRPGKNSIDEDDNPLIACRCENHGNSLTTSQFNMWFNHIYARVLTPKDIFKVSQKIPDMERQLGLALELGIEQSEIDTANSNNPNDIKMASYKILKSWFEGQNDRTEAFGNLCKALEEANMGRLLTECLHVQ